MFKLIFVFFYVGLFTVGGGLVAIPLIQQEVVARGWITIGEFYQMVAIAESTPGPIGINIATYVGYSQYGIIGSLLATIGFIVPSFVIVSLLAQLLQKHRNRDLVKNWFLFVKAAVVGLIGYALANVADYAFFDSELQGSIRWDSVLLMVFLTISYYFLKEKPWTVIILGAVAGMVFL